MAGLEKMIRFSQLVLGKYQKNILIKNINSCYQNFVVHKQDKARKVYTGHTRPFYWLYTGNPHTYAMINGNIN